jgi:hypothetical protein
MFSPPLEISRFLPTVKAGRQMKKCLPAKAFASTDASAGRPVIYTHPLRKITLLSCKGAILHLTRNAALYTVAAFAVVAHTVHADFATTAVAAHENPCALAVNPVTDKVYVANYSSNNVTIIDDAPLGREYTDSGHI